jgi:hypothetical protein
VRRWLGTPTQPLFVEGTTYLVPILLEHALVRVLPFVPRHLSAHDDSLVEGEVHLPDGTTAHGIVPVHTLRRDT